MAITSKDGADLFFLVKSCADDFNSFLLLRMFVGGYQNASDKEFRQAVDQLLDAYTKERLGNVNAALSARDGVATDVERTRTQSHEAVTVFCTSVKQYLLDLRFPPEAKR